MAVHRSFAVGLVGITLLFAPGPRPVLHAADEPTPTSGVADGIVIDVGNKGEKFITVRKDGDEEPIKYTYDDSIDKRSLEALSKTIFVVGRVHLRYKVDGDRHQLVSVEKVVGRQTGTVYGEVLFAHGWWIELKPKSGPPEGYAATYPKEKWQQTEEFIKTLSKGDIVGIKFYTDGERHRIDVIEKKPK